MPLVARCEEIALLIVVKLVVAVALLKRRESERVRELETVLDWWRVIGREQIEIGIIVHLVVICSTLTCTLNSLK